MTWKIEIVYQTDTGPRTGLVEIGTRADARRKWTRLIERLGCLEARLYDNRGKWVNHFIQGRGQMTPAYSYVRTDEKHATKPPSFRERNAMVRIKRAEPGRIKREPVRYSR